MKKSLWYIGGVTLSLMGASASNASPVEQSVEKATINTVDNLSRVVGVDETARIGNSQTTVRKIAQATPGDIQPIAAPPIDPNLSETQDLQNQLKNIGERGATEQRFETFVPKVSPSQSIFNPTGFGADRGQVFLGGSYQSRTRKTDISDGEAVIGVGLGDATNAVGLEVSYSINSFGTSQGFGSGGFNAKLHKRLSDDTSVAIGWNQFAQISAGNGRNGTNLGSDYPKNSYYAVGTKIVSPCENPDGAFCRIALTAGVGSGAFLPFETVRDARAKETPQDATGANVFGSVAFRIARPISAIVEWTGQDLAAGVSIAPFDNFPLVITPAFRDIAGGGKDDRGARFVLGAGLSFQF